MSKESLIIPTSSKTTNEMMQLSTSRTISKEQ